jgi:hypothetical protein
VRAHSRYALNPTKIRLGALDPHAPGRYQCVIDRDADDVEYRARRGKEEIAAR